MKKKKRKITKKYTWKPTRANYYLIAQKKERQKLKRKKKGYVRPTEIPGWIWDEEKKSYKKKLG